MNTPARDYYEPIELDPMLRWNKITPGLFWPVTPEDRPNPWDKFSVTTRTKPSMTTLRYQPDETKSFLKPKIADQRQVGTIDSKGRSNFFATELPKYPPLDIRTLLRDTMSERLNKYREPGYFFDGSGSISSIISESELPSYRAQLHSFKTFLKEDDALHARNYREPLFLVVTPNQLLAYPSMLPLSMNYGLQLVEPHYVFTSYLWQDTKLIYFFKRKKVNRYYSSQSFVMKTEFYENILNALVNDQSKLSLGYVMSGLGYVFNHSHDRGYNLLRNVLSNHHRPDFIINILIPEGVMEEIPETTVYDPASDYTILLYNYQVFKDTIANKYFEGRILDDDYVPKIAPFCFSTEHGTINYVTLLEWKTVKPKLIMFFYAENFIVDDDDDDHGDDDDDEEEDEIELYDKAGIVPDFVTLFTKDEYNFEFDLGNYLYECLYASFFTATYPKAVFSVLRQPTQLEEIQEWVKIKPVVPYFECKYDKPPSAWSWEPFKGNETDNRWFLQIAWGNGNPADLGIRQGYYNLHIDSAIPSLPQLARFANTVTPIKDKLNLRDIEGRIEYFQNIKKLPLEMQ